MNEKQWMCGNCGQDLSTSGKCERCGSDNVVPLMAGAKEEVIEK